MELHLMRPEWLWTLVPAAVLLLLLWYQRGRSGSWSEVIEPELLPHLVGGGGGGRKTNLLPLLLLGWVLTALAASGPSWKKIPQPIHQKQDALVLVLDLSYSMKSSDLAPSRLDRSRQKLLDLLDQRREGQTGLIAYAGDAHIVTPLTDDIATIANLLPALNPDMMPVAGSEPGPAMAMAADLLHSAGIRQGKVLLVTDGVSPRDAKAVARALDGTGIQLGIMGVGTSTGAPIPLPRGGFLKDRQGAIVMPALVDNELRQLAEDTSSRYMRMQLDDSDLDYLLADRVLPERSRTIALDRTADTWEDQGYLLILVLLPLALATFRRGWVLGLLPLLLAMPPEKAYADIWDDLWLTRDQQGQRALSDGDIEGASALFENPDWAGTAAYRGGDFEAAVEHFSTNEDADAWYNRGNALARAGRLDEAIAAYEESLSRQPDQADARENIELLEQLKQQQQEQQQQQQQQGDQQEQPDQNQDQNQQQGQQQNQQDQQQAQQDDQQEGQGQDQQQSPPQDSPQYEQDPESGEQQEPSQAQQQEQQEPGDQRQTEGTNRDSSSERTPQEMAAAQADQESRERDQAMEQWLRRVPDDPSGLLREKFRYESQQRQRQGGSNNDENYW